MDVDGNQLKEALKMASLELSIVKTQFEDTLFKFDDEEKESPGDVADRIDELESRIAKLQTAQSLYNLSIEVEVLGETMLLEEAIKRVGGAGRLSKTWRNASAGRVRDRWSTLQASVRKDGEETAKPTITKLEALGKAKAAEKFASALRSAISTGNTVKVTIDWVDESLLG
jgi:hypothetical protein